MLSLTGLEADFLRAFTRDEEKDIRGTRRLQKVSMVRHKTTLFVTYDEDSVTNRRTRLPSQLNSVHLLEHCFVVTKAGLDITNRKRLHFKGSTLGDAVGPVAIPATEDVWQETFANKKLIFGAARVAVGGRDGMSLKEVMDEDEEIEGVKKVKDVKEVKKAFVRNDADLEPVCFHGHGQHLTEEVMRTLVKREMIKGVVDQTPGDGELAHLCITRRIPYIGFPLTDSHMTRLMGHLQNRVWKDMKTEGSEMYEVGLVEIMGQAEKNDAEMGSSGQDSQEVQGGRGRGRGARGRGARGRGSKSNPEADPSKTKAQGKTVIAKRNKAKANANGEDGGEDPAEESEDSNDGQPDDDGALKSKFKRSRTSADLGSARLDRWLHVLWLCQCDRRR